MKNILIEDRVYRVHDGVYERLRSLVDMFEDRDDATIQDFIDDNCHKWKCLGTVHLSYRL